MMKNSISILCVVLLLGAFSCNNKGKKNTKTFREKDITNSKDDTQLRAVAMNKADSLVAKAVTAHGGKLYDTAYFGFRFRKNNYTFQNKEGSYMYTSAGQKNDEEILDVVENGTLTRTINGVETKLSTKDIAKYTEALNSVIYFATLPFKLQDAAVNKSYEGRQTIKGEQYDAISVTFKKEGGGTDFNDAFLYWIHTETSTIDYLAYSYATNDGGVRFRSAYNPRTVGGIRFQNYINYEAPIDTPLSALPDLYESGKLKELSRIDTEDVREIKA